MYGAEQLSFLDFLNYVSRERTHSSSMSSSVVLTFPCCASRRATPFRASSAAPAAFFIIQKWNTKSLVTSCRLSGIDDDLAPAKRDALLDEGVSFARAAHERGDLEDESVEVSRVVVDCDGILLNVGDDGVGGVGALGRSVVDG